MTILQWLSLKNTPGVGPYLFSQLLSTFGSPENVISASYTAITEVDGISHKTARNILEKKIGDREKRELETTLNNNCNIITFLDKTYPKLLKEIHDPPPLLYVAGKLIEDSVSLAIVGSRSATSYGLKNASDIAFNLSLRGIEVVSGMARGIDTSAHTGAMKGNGRTIAVLGSGLGNIYPKENSDLAYKISETGAVISELPFYAPPEAHNFPLRNRIISGMCLGTVVIEAAKKSGSLITAKLALEHNREVFALPGSVASAKSSGTHNLLKQGARLVETADDILEEFPFLSHTNFSNNNSNIEKNLTNNRHHSNTIDDKNNHLELDFDELSVLKVLDSYPVHIDEIQNKLSINMGKLSGILLNLELRGIIQQTPGKFFSICEESRWQNR
jgi:DNA processing protein